MKLKIYCFLNLIYYIYTSSSEEEVLKKGGKKKTKYNYIIFESKDFSEGKNMKFMLKSSSYCYEELKYGYSDDLENILNNGNIPYSVSLSEEENEFKDYIKILSSKFFTIKKKKDELDGSNGDYLLLYFGCSGEIEIENYKLRLTKRIKLILILAAIGLILIILVVTLVLCFYCKKKQKLNPKLCLYCGSNNHIAFNCPSINNNNQFNFEQKNK
jgi:hypothetical protein